MNDDLIYIKKFNKIKISKICKKLKIDYSNTLNGRTTNKNYKKIRKEIENKIAHLYLIED